MARDLTLGRTEAEMLVDLLEDCDPEIVGTWRHDLAAELRELFGMISLEEKNKVRQPEKFDVGKSANRWREAFIDFVYNLSPQEKPFKEKKQKVSNH